MELDYGAVGLKVPVLQELLTVKILKTPVLKKVKILKVSLTLQI